MYYTDIYYTCLTKPYSMTHVKAILSKHFLFANVSKKDDFIQNIVIIMRIEDDLTRTLLFFTLTVIGIGILAWVICWH